MGEGDVPTMSFDTIYNLNHHLEGQRSLLVEREREGEEGGRKEKGAPPICAFDHHLEYEISFFGLWVEGERGKERESERETERCF